MNTVLFLTLYPVVPARHGGQHRALNLINLYKSLGYEVEHFFSVVEPDSATWKELSCDYELVPTSFINNHDYGKLQDLYDFISGEYFRTEKSIKDKLLSVISHKNVKIIHVEQPWQMAAIHELKVNNRQIFQDITIVYGSQNIEYKLKESVLSELPDSNLIINDVRECEIDAARNADIVLAVSESERKELIDFGAKNVILAQNGISRRNIISGDLSCFSEVLPEKYLIFVGSAHQPNLDGFMRLIGPALGCIPMGEKIVIVGTVGDLIQQHPDYIRWLKLNQSKVIFIKNVSDSQLESLIQRASAFVLPILSGGGTNLKTAEALFSKKAIIATSTSFRGFDDFIDESVIISDDKLSFREAIRNHHLISHTRSKKLDSLLWDSCFETFKNHLKGL
ncbi:glycosyltransferase family 4 protein [Vibrio chagasii]|uniref:glycosyltransferase family 4 protein n=1 Tax=Vibrio chagasii TaxID=170679 RepID=UPI001EFE14E4|nr:glycosyltransferase family 4 protein [Vibrio chagasii]MCG9563298.1 glycosyltransferase family 4 protein [Vibrio chagasii]